MIYKKTSLKANSKAMTTNSTLNIYMIFSISILNEFKYTYFLVKEVN